MIYCRFVFLLIIRVSCFPLYVIYVVPFCMHLEVRSSWNWVAQMCRFGLIPGKLTLGCFNFQTMHVQDLELFGIGAAQRI